MKRQDTALESQGAEFLVLGHLLIDGVLAYKSYTNFPGYDLIAVNPENEKVAKLQIKSRWATNYDKSFPIRNFDCDFVIHVALNRGYAFGRIAKNDDTGVKPPQFYVFPVEVVKNAQNKDSTWEKICIQKIPNLNFYLNNWDLIREFLKR